ncbi:hypothetical protein KUCAC02_023933, partial [Chaenocephalus aceratus]
DDITLARSARAIPQGKPLDHRRPELWHKTTDSPPQPLPSFRTLSPKMTFL